MPLLARGQDMVQVYCLAEAYLLLGGVEALGPALQPLMDHVAATFERVLASQPAVGAAAAQARKAGQHAGGGGAHAAARARFGGRAGMLQPGGDGGLRGWPGWVQRAGLGTGPGRSARRELAGVRRRGALGAAVVLG